MIISNQEFKAFCACIYTEAYEYYKALPVGANTIERLIEKYVILVKNNANAKDKLIERILKEAVSLQTMKQSLKFAVMSGSLKGTPPHKMRVIEEVEKFINSPNDVINELHLMAKKQI